MPKYYLPLCIARPQAKYLFIRTTQESLYPEKKKNMDGRLQDFGKK